MKKRTLSLLLALSLWAGMTAPALAAGQGGFDDVKPEDYFAQAVGWAAEQRIASGTSETTFSPNQTCSVAQIITFLWRFQGSPVSVGAPFEDVSHDDYYDQAALWAWEKKIVSGHVFGGGAPCTRAMAATYLWKLAGSPAAGPCKFEDVPADAAYAQAVAWAAEQGIVSGTSETTFSPDQTCTRGQIVTLLHRASDVLPQQQQEMNIAEAAGVYRKGKYEMTIVFNTPKIGVTIRNTKYGTVPLTAGMTCGLRQANKAYSDDIVLLAYPGYVTIEFSGDFAHLNSTLGGRYDLAAE